MLRKTETPSRQRGFTLPRLIHLSLCMAGAATPPAFGASLPVGGGQADGGSTGSVGKAVADASGQASSATSATSNTPDASQPKVNANTPDRGTPGGAAGGSSNDGSAS